MAFDGVTTYSIVKELQNIINYKINKIYQPNKNTIIIEIYSKGQILNLLCCISNTSNRIHLTNNLTENPLVPPNFCMLLRKQLIGLKIKKIYTLDLERIVYIDVENNENPNKPIKRKLIIELMGKHSNIILTDDSYIIIESLRHTSIENNASRDIYPTSRYIAPKNSKYNFLDITCFEDFYKKIYNHLTDFVSINLNKIENITIDNFNIDKIISNTYTGISSSLIKGIIINKKISILSKDSLELIYQEIKSLIHSPNIEIENFNFKNDFYLNSKKSKDKPIKIIDNTNKNNNFILNFSIDYFYYKKETKEYFLNYKNSILNIVLASLKKYNKRLININKKLDECKNMDTYRFYGELITANLYRIKDIHSEEIQVENYYDNNNLITIPLDKKFSPSYNAKKYFQKYTKLKNAKNIVIAQKEETISDINYIESVIYELDNSSNIDDINDIYNEISENNIFETKKYIKNKENKKKPKERNKNKSFNPLKYYIDGYTILIGRNNKENDYLTCKYAKKNDIWFHTKEIHGSHVILRIENNEPITEEIIYQTAKLAIQHSKGKNSSHVPVDYCQISFVKKPTGSKPGYVIYSNNKTIII